MKEGGQARSWGRKRKCERMRVALFTCAHLPRSCVCVIALPLLLHVHIHDIHRVQPTHAPCPLDICPELSQKRCKPLRDKAP